MFEFFKWGSFSNFHLKVIKHCDSFSFLPLALISFIPIFNIWTHLFVCFCRLRVIFFPPPQLKEYIRSSSHALPLITFIPIKLPRTESGKGRGEGIYYTLDCVRGFIGWSRRMVHPPTPIPSSLFLLAFCESLHLPLAIYLSLSLSRSTADPLHK